jgi:hypothetical protein
MRRAILYLIIICALCNGCSSAKKTVHSNAATSELANDGSSYDKAIIIHEDHERPGIDAEYAWILNKYPGYKNRGQSLSNYKSKPYDIIHITTTDDKQLDVYFDISNFYGKF